MADYTTLANVKAEVPDGGFSTTDYDAQISSLITVASRLIDSYLGVGMNYFYPSTSDETRYFDGNGGTEVKIDDAVSITTLSVAETGDTTYTAWATSDLDYYVKPYNYAALGVPINMLVVDHNGDKYNIPAFPKAVKVVGIFGYSTAVPALIEQACEIQVIHWLMRSKQAWQNAGANENFLTDAGGKLDEDVKAILMPFMIGRL